MSEKEPRLNVFEFLDVKFTQATVAQGKDNGFSLYLHGRTQAVHKLIAFLRWVHTVIQVPTVITLWLAYKLRLTSAPQVPDEILELRKKRDEAKAQAQKLQAVPQPPLA